MTEKSSTTLKSVENLPQKILVAVDFSEDSRAALLSACHFAECSDADLIALHVVHDPVARPGFYRRSKKDAVQPMQTVAEEMMEEFLQAVAEDQPGLSALGRIDTRFVTGLPPTRIVEVAELMRAELIVMGCRGITGLPHRMLGSTAERVVEISPLPVLVVKTDKPQEPDKKELKRREKQQKKDRKRLKKMLKSGQEVEQPDNADG